MSGEGSLYRRERTRPSGQVYVRWIAQVSYGPRHERRIVRRVRRTRAEAKAALEEMLGPQSQRRYLGDWLRSWLHETAGPSLAPNTIRGYEFVIASLAPLHAITLPELTAEDIEGALNRMVSARHVKKPEDVKPASAKTRRNALAMLRTALGVAHQRGYVNRNVALLVKMPRVPRRDIPVLTPPIARAVLKAVEGDRYEAAYALGLCGLRIGEVLGLAWQDVDLDAATVDVRWQAVGSGKRAQRAQLKTRASAAPVPLPPFVVERLTEHRRAQREERLAKGWPRTDEGHVFITERGFVVNGNWLSKHFTKLVEAAGLPSMTFHGLRHGAASLLAAAGTHPRVAQQLLRHSTTRTTLDAYTHVTRGQEREAADALERMVAG